jgi:hypothetical protein
MAYKLNCSIIQERRITFRESWGNFVDLSYRDHAPSDSMDYSAL